MPAPFSLNVIALQVLAAYFRIVGMDFYRGHDHGHVSFDRTLVETMVVSASYNPCADGYAARIKVELPTDKDGDEEITGAAIITRDDPGSPKLRHDGLRLEFRIYSKQGRGYIEFCQGTNKIGRALCFKRWHRSDIYQILDPFTERQLE